MEFGLSKEQELIINSISQYLGEKGDLERVRQYVDGGETRAEDLRFGLRDLDVSGLIIDEKYGGVGLKFIDAALVAEALGNHATPVPFVASQVMAPLAIASAGSEEQQSRWLPGIADGTVVAGAAITEAVSARMDAGVQWDGATLNGKSLFVLDFEADLYVVADEKRAL